MFVSEMYHNLAKGQLIMTSFSSAIFHIVSSKQREDAKWLNV